jgi:hypothetical protein
MYDPREEENAPLIEYSKELPKPAHTVAKIIRIKIFDPGNNKHKVYIFRAPNGRSFIEAGVEDILGKVVAEVEKMYPEHDYRMVQVGRADYNFLDCGHKAVAGEDIVVAGLRLGEVVTVEVGS